MPRYKVLKSVAHNVADSFVSALNYTRDGHVICHLLMESRSTQEEGYFMDFRSGTHSEIFDRRSLEVVAPFYTRMFWENVEKQGSSDSYVAFAKLVVRFDLSIRREAQAGFENPYHCEVELVDDRGINHSQAFTGWWAPEPWLLDAPLRWRIERFFKRLWG